MVKEKTHLKQEVRLESYIKVALIMALMMEGKAIKEREKCEGWFRNGKYIRKEQNTSE